MARRGAAARRGARGALLAALLGAAAALAAAGGALGVEECAPLKAKACKKSAYCVFSKVRARRRTTQPCSVAPNACAAVQGKHQRKKCNNTPGCQCTRNPSGKGKCGGCVPASSPSPSPTPSARDYACGAMRSDDPRVWGPRLWFALHIFARWYPVDPRPEIQKHCADFLKSLPIMLPSSSCGQNLLTFLRRQSKSWNQICSTRENLVSLFVQAQNDVSKYTQPLRAPWTDEEAMEAYSQNVRDEGSCRHNILWNGHGMLCKHVTQTPYVTGSGVFPGGLANPSQPLVCQTYNQAVANTPPGGVNPYTPPVTGAGVTGSGAGKTCWGGLEDVPGCEYNPWSGIPIYPWVGEGKAELIPLGPGAAEGTAQAFACYNEGDPTRDEETYSFMDPRSFGPVVWPALHNIAYWYPEDPTDDLKQHCAAFVQALPVMLPCSTCGNDFLNFQLRGAPGFFEPKPGESLVASACAGRDALFNFFVQAHNNVNRHTNPLRLSWTVQQAETRYAVEEVCFHNPVWVGPGGPAGLCRAAAGPPGCTPYTF